MARSKSRAPPRARSRAPPSRSRHGAWIESARPQIGPYLTARLRLASRLTAAEVAAAAAQRAGIRRRLDELPAGDALLLDLIASGIGELRQTAAR